MKAKPNGKYNGGRNTTLSLDFGVGVIYPSAGSLCAMLSARYPASRSLVMFSSMTEEAIHLPPALDMLRSYGEGENLGAGARGCENG